MNDADRIRALRHEGRIDDAQAERLLNALGAIEADDVAASRAHPPDDAHRAASGAPPQAESIAGEAVFGATASGATVGRRAPPTTTPPPAGAPSGPGTAPGAASEPDVETPDASTAKYEAAGVDRWARIDLFACEATILIDPAITAPAVDAKDGGIEVEDLDGGWRVGQRGGDGTWLERLVDGVQRSRIRLRLPPRTGVRLDVKAGDVDIRGVPALRGRLMAGDLDASGLRAVDVVVAAGDVDLAIDPVPGAHRLRLSVGDAKVRLADGADVRVEGHVSIGDASAPHPFVTARKGMVAASVDGTLGEGRATVRIDVGTGDLKVETGHDGG